MKQSILRTATLIVTIFLLTSMTFTTNVVINPKAQKEFNDFFAKRSLVYSSIPELEDRYKTKFNFYQKLKINLAKKKISKQLKNDILLEGCDTIKLKTGEEIAVIVSEISSTEIKYKKCENKTGPTYIMRRSDIAMIHYANGSMELLDNNNLKGKNAQHSKTDLLAILSIPVVIAGLTLPFLISAATIAGPALVIGGIILVVAGIVLGIVSRNRIKKSNGKLKGIGLANTGIFIGSILLGLFAIGSIWYYSQN